MQKIDLQKNSDARSSLVKAREVFTKLQKNTPTLLPELSDIRKATNTVIANLDHILTSTTPVSYMEIATGMVTGAGLFGAAQAELHSSSPLTSRLRQNILSEFCIDFEKSGYTTSIAQQLENAKNSATQRSI